jgi:hypothetical protein
MTSRYSSTGRSAAVHPDRQSCSRLVLRPSAELPILALAAGPPVSINVGDRRDDDAGGSAGRLDHAESVGTD